MLKRKLSAWFGQSIGRRSLSMGRRRVGSQALWTIQRLESRALLTDASPYVVSLARSSGSDVSLGGSVTFDVAFSEVVNGVDVSDFSVVRTGTTASSTLTVADTGDHRNFQVTVGGISGVGTLGLNLLDNGSIRDVAGQGLVNSGSVPSFANYQSFSVGSNPESLALADLNGDAIGDLIVSNTGATPNGTISVLLGNGNGTFQNQVTYATGREPRGVVVGDLNGDGKLDILFANQKDKTVGVLLGNGNGTFAAQQTHGTGRDPNDLVLGDYNADGKPDVAIVNTKDNSITILTGKGDGTFSAEQTFSTGTSPVAIDVADLNGDGKSDIVVAHSTSNTAGVLLGNGNGTFQAVQSYATGTQPKAITHGDVNNDGRIDLAVAALQSDRVSVLLGNGDGTFQSQQQYVTGAGPGAVLLRDLDGDGQLDLVAANRTGNSLSVRSGLGDGTFSAAQTFATATAPYAIVSGDVNGDGKRDLLTANRSSNSVSVLTSSLTGNFTGQVYQVVEPVLHWQGDVDSKWSTPGNWLENRAPMDGMDLWFDVNTTGFAGRFLTENDLVGLKAGLIRVNDSSSAGDFELQGNALSVKAGMVIQADSEFRVNLAGISLLSHQSFELSAGTKSLWNSPIDLQGWGLILQGGDTELAGVISGTGGVTFKSGSFFTTAQHTYTGPTTLKSTLIMDGGSVSATTVEAGGTLLGKGVITAPITVAQGGRIQAKQRGGQQAAILQTGNLVTNVGSTLEFPVGGSTAGSAAGKHGALQVSGTVTLAGDLNIQRLNGFIPTTGQELVLISNDGSDTVSGTFTELWEGAILNNFLGTGHAARISYHGGDGNDVSLTVLRQELHWQGDVSVYWSNPNNWLEGIQPVDAAHLIFDSQTSDFGGRVQMNNDLVGLKISIEVLDSPAGSNFEFHGNAITLSGDAGYGVGMFTALDSSAILMNLAGVRIDSMAYILVITDTPSIWNSPIDLQSHELFLHSRGESHFNGAISGNGNVKLAGDMAPGDIATLTAANTWTGWTELVGIWSVMGSTVSPTTVRGQLRGEGTIQAPVKVTEPGRITTTNPLGYQASVLSVGSLTTEAHTVLEFPIGGIIAGNGLNRHGQLRVTGHVVLEGELGILPGQNGFLPDAGQEFILIDNDGTDAVIGTFAGLPEGTVLHNFLGTGHNATISYHGGDGNDVTLTASPQMLHWQGDVDSKWSTAGNWLENAVPLPGGQLYFDDKTTGFAGNFNPVNDIQGLSVGMLIVNDTSSAGDFTLSGLPISISGGVQVHGDAGFAVQMERVSLTATQTLQLNAKVTDWTSPLVIDTGLITIQGQRIELSGAISGAGGLVVQSPDVTLKGVNTYTGKTVVMGQVTLTGTSASPMEIAGDGRLLGNGTTTAAIEVSAGGRVAPGIPASGKPTGAISVGDLKLGAAGILDAEIRGIQAGHQTEGYDQLLVSGTVTLAGVLSVVLPTDFVPAGGESFVIIQNDGQDSVTGTFEGRAEGSLHKVGDITFRISYSGGDGNDVSLTTLFVTYIVSTTANSGKGSLSAAITDANTHPGKDVIVFQVSGAIDGPFPLISDTVQILGNTAPGYTEAPVVQLRGDGAGEVHGLQFSAGTSQSTVRGLSITGFAGSGLWISASNVAVHGNWVGVSPTGQKAGNKGHGIAVQSGSVTIGGNTAADRNVISGNLQEGILIWSESEEVKRISGNYIGTNVGGTESMGNGWSGIAIVAGGARVLIGGDANSGAGNLISGNLGSGIVFDSAGAGNRVSGNRIGTNAAGSLSLGNGAVYDASAGISIANMGNRAVIIGTDGDGNGDAGEGNLISGNYVTGIKLIEFETAGNHVIAGNRIGVDAGGTGVLPNRGHGVHIQSASFIRIGTNSDGESDAEEANIIAGNRVEDAVNGTDYASGILIEDTANITPFDNIISGNFIGTDRLGIASLGNQGDGITIRSAMGTIIGTASGEESSVLTQRGGNIIRFNRGAGVRISGTVMEGLAAEQFTFLRANSFQSNSVSAVDVGESGPTINSTGDQSQDFPILESAAIENGDLILTGFASAGAMVEFYLNSPRPGQVFGEGFRRIGRMEEGSDADLDTGEGSYGPTVRNVQVADSAITQNRFRFSIPLSEGIDNGVQLTAIVTGGSSGGVSEFSPLILVGEQGSVVPPEVTLDVTAAQQPWTQAEGEQFSVSGSFYDPDSRSWTATVDYGEGDGPVQLALTDSKTFDLHHRYTTPGTYEVTVLITDNGLATGTATLTVTITNEIPQAQFDTYSLTRVVNEGEVVTLSGSFTDGGGEHVVVIEWGDGDTSTVTLASGTQTFTASHVYVDDTNAAGVVTDVDIYSVRITIRDTGVAGGLTSPEGFFLVDVANVAPEFSGVTFNGQNPGAGDLTSIIEGDVIVVAGVFTDPSTTDLHTLRITWGDGEVSVVTLPVGTQQFDGLPGLSHRYRNDDDDGQYTVQLELWDDDQPLSVATWTRTIAVANRAPSDVQVLSVPAVIDEGGTIRIEGAFSDPGPDDGHQVRVIWGDGSPDSILNLGPGVTSFSGDSLRHQYLNNAAAAATYTIQVEVTDLDNALATGIGTAVVTVQNVAPLVSALNVVRADGQSGVIAEGEAVTVTGSFSDSSPLDRHVVTITWGDGRQSEALVDATNRTFTASHVYTDNYVSASITATVADGRYSGTTFLADGGSVTSAPVAQTITNVSPSALIAPVAGATPTVTQLTVEVEDPGLDDLATLSYVWEINNGFGYTTQGTSQVLTFDSTQYYAPLIRVRVQDKDGGAGAFEVVAVFGTTASETITVTTTGFTRQENGSGDPAGSGGPAAPIGGGLTWPNQILVLGFAGEDLLDASSLPATHLAILDGGQQQDYLIGGAGADNFYPNDGNDSVDGGAGNDRFVLTPNSTLTVIDTSGFNTLDFSRSAFSDASGITFDLTKIRSTGLPDADLDAQVVSTVGATHIVAAYGIFQQLIGSQFADSLTVRSGATIYGGAGADTLYVGEGTAGATLSGGADDDLLVVNGTNISGLSFGGDDGQDVMRNLGTITDLTFGGGADDDILENAGAIAGTLVFGGDDGVDVLTNTGTIGVLNFNGGADDDIFLNNGSLTTTLRFGGDADILLSSPGTIGTLVFSGDDGADIFANLGTISTLTFTGGADDDVFVNVGTQTTLNFGGDDDVLLSNSGTMGTIGTLIFSGDDGSDLLRNLGTISTLTFNGGADDDVLSNLAGGTLSGLVFGGDSGSDVLRNEGAITELLFTGGADDDILLNVTGGTIQGLNFGGDDGSDLLTNYGVIDDLVFTGGADDDVLTNLGGMTGTLVFGGDAGADILRNSGALEALVFSGGADDDIFVNLGGGLAGGLIFSGDDGIDLFQNSGAVTSLSFGGGADDDVLVNNVGAEITTLVFGGDRELNLSGGLSRISSAGDDGVDTLLNSGSIGGLTFFGGADDDIFVNQVTGTVNTLSFGGDDGSDVLRNSGAVTTLTFGGGADDDTLVNTGTISGTLVFGGDREFDDAGSLQGISGNADDGVDTLANYGIVNSLQFTGGADDDVLLNQTGATVSELLFQGDSGSDVLRNDGIVTTLTFSGGADDDVLINTGNAVAALVFGGDSGNDALYNTGINLGTLTFTGGADDDVLLNTGSGLTSLEFAGGADDDILQNSGSGITELVFRGDSGSDILRNTGNGISTLTFGGGADDDVLFSSGELVGGIVFGGDLDLSTGAVMAGTNSGNDLLIVQGSGSGVAGVTIIFYGDDGADAFRYSATGFVELTFEGGADDDVFQTNTDNATLITFSGGADDDVLENNGQGVTGLVFAGDSGDDTLYNNGDHVLGLVFQGGSDDDTLINTGANLTSLVFSGDSGADVLVNAGNALDGLTFTGGADDDIFQNSGASLSQVSFYGDEGSDRFLNRATAVQLSGMFFRGDAGNDVLLNYAGGVTDLTFEGGADDDVFQNSGVSISGLLFEGGADDDVFLNQSAGAITDLTFGGDDGGDTLLNTGSISILIFGGGADDDALVNRGTVTTLTFGGDQELEAGGLGAATDASDDGNDSLLNDGAVTVLQFTGGADDDLLVSNGPVGTLYFEGGADDDTLQNNGQVLTLQFLGGADDDVFYNNADGIGSLVFSGDDGADTFVNKGSELSSLTFSGGADSDTLRVHGSEIAVLVFDGGSDSAADSFHYNAIGGAGSSVNCTFGPGDDYFAWRGSADSLTYLGGDGNDQAIILGSGALTLDGGQGNDRYYFQSNPQADVLLVETSSGVDDQSLDTLDFSAFTGGALNLDLRQVAKQSQSSEFSITLSDGLGIENVVGTPLADVISGNSRNNQISGAQYGAGFGGSVAGSRGSTQWVLLDFDTWTDAGEHVYTAAERLAIATRIESVYRGPDTLKPWFDVRVVLDRSEIPVAEGSFASVYFNRTPDFGRPGGLASEIDPGNLNLGGTAIVQVNGLLGGVITAEDISDEGGDAGGDKADVRPVGDEEIGASKPAATSENFILLSAKIGAHELGHLIGLRHQDSFGPIGFGLHDPPGSAAYKPVYAGPVAGVETFDHLMGSGASVGSDRFNDLKDLFFGEREVIKLGYAFSNVADTVTNETTTAHATAATAQPLSLVTVEVPNTLTRGLNASRDLFVQMQSVEGTISLDNGSGRSESDWYSFAGTAGTILNVEVYSNSLIRYGTGVDDYVDSITRVWFEKNGVLTLVPFYGSEAVNDDIFEPTDSAIVDLVLPETGTYYIEVDTFARDPADPIFDPTNPSSPLNPSNLGNILSYPELLARFLDTRDDTDTGHYHLFISGFATASAADDIDTIVGYGGTDTIEGGEGDSYALSLNPGSAGTAFEGSGFSRVLTLVDRAAISWAGSTVDYGDGLGPQALVVDASGTFELNHVYADDGTWAITMEIRDDIGQTLTKTLQVNVANVAPTILSLSGPSSADERTTQTYSFTASDPGNDTFLVEAVSGGIRGTASNVQLNSATGSGTFDVTFSAGSGDTVISIILKDSDGASSSSATLVVTVHDVNDTPTAVALSASSIAENAATQTAIGTLSTTDPDAGDTFTYTLIDGAGATDNDSFLIDGSTLRSNRVFDYESKAAYSIRVRTTDSGGLWFEQVLAITVTDVEEDVTAPVSRILALPNSVSTPTITLTATGSDSGANASGILEYEFYYSTGGAFSKIGTSPAGSPTMNFIPVANTTYWFRSLAIDNAGNRETKTTSDTYTRVGDITPPSSVVTSATATTSGKFSLQISGTKVSGALISGFDVYVRLDGAAAVLIGSCTATSTGAGQYSGSITWQGKLDGVSHTYGFYSRARDLSGNVEAAPAGSDVSVTATFAAASLTATGIDVQNGANQRSWVRYLDVLFSDDPSAMLGAGRVSVERFSINAASAAAGTGNAVTGYSIVKSGNNLKLDFGTDGLGGKMQNGDGLYRVRLDMNGNGLFTDSGDSAFEFFRLFGDADGNGTVDIADTNLITAQVGRSGANLDGDIDGSGLVTTTDRMYSIRQRGRKLLGWMLSLLDD